MDTKDKCYFIATEIGLGSGGIQTWAFYIVKLLRENNMLYGYYSKKGSSFGALLKLVRANFACRVFILMDWQKFVFALPALVLTSLGLKKASFAVLYLAMKFSYGRIEEIHTSPACEKQACIFYFRQ